ncbi:MAG: LuxR family transcriptional regulator [Alphaproteobacteria bacterium]|nr:MAG: LuxR family transcriptional regulator [Alphaproteobacteria bacterium]
MSQFAIAEAFVGDACAAKTQCALYQAMMACCASMGINYFALLHHVDFARDAGTAIRLHSYPADWQVWFDERGLGQSDPVHRASHAISIGFRWSAVPQLIKLTANDREILATAARFGIGEGFTVPANVPGEVHASCSFAMEPGQPFPEEFHFVAQLVGGFAFEAARRLSRGPHLELPTLTDRQRDCVLWAARGKTDWEISQILGVSHETVIGHLKQARERYGVSKRALLAVRALFDGQISFSDVFKH